MTEPYRSLSIVEPLPVDPDVDTTVRVRVRLAGHVDGRSIPSDGATLNQAVAKAAQKLAGPGRTLLKTRIDTHLWRWLWGTQPHSRVVLLVREGRSGPSGRGTKPVVCLSLSKEALERVDALAGELGMSRSATIEWLINRHRS